MGTKNSVIGAATKRFESDIAITSDLAAIEGLALNLGALTDQGVVLQISTPEYFYSKLSNTKMSLLSEAAIDARHRAEEIVGNSGIRLGIE